MKALLILAVIVAIGYFNYKKSEREVFSEKGFPQIVEKANKDFNFPKTHPSGIVLERIEAAPGLQVVQRITLPVLTKEIDSSRFPKDELKKEFSDVYCGNAQMEDYLVKGMKWLRDNGVKWQYIIEDKTGHSVMELNMTPSDCPAAK